MDERKNIERFFQEKFKNFEADPPEHIWERIDQSLSKKDTNRKVIPLWWKIAGAAALLAGVLWTGNLFLSPDIPSGTPAVTESSTIDSTSIDGTQESVVTNDPKDAQDPSTTLDTPSNTPTSPTQEIHQVQESNSMQAVAKAPSKSDDIPESSLKQNLQNKDRITQDQVIAQVDKTKKDPAKKGRNSLINKSKKENQLEDLKNNIDDSSWAQIDEPSNKEIKDKEDNSDKPSILEAVEGMKKSQQDALASNENAQRNLRWSVQPNVAPIYYNSLSQGSPLSQQFAENSKQGDITISYGVNIAYQISKRLSIRSGLNAVDMGYATDGIEFGPAISSTQGHQLNVRFNNAPVGAPQHPNIALSDGKTPLYSEDVELQARSEKTYQGSINQKFGYLEIPLELKYRLVDTKVGVNIIGGFSSLFLTDNKVIISSRSNLKSEVGEASNLNNTSFSTNIGIGLDYQFSDKLLLNLEPMFKYQMGTFSSDDGGFSPYMLGVYTGLSFSF